MELWILVFDRTSASFSVEIHTPFFFAVSCFIHFSSNSKKHLIALLLCFHHLLDHTCEDSFDFLIFLFLVKFFGVEELEGTVDKGTVDSGGC